MNQGELMFICRQKGSVRDGSVRNAKPFLAAISTLALVLATAGCSSSVSDERLESFSLEAASFGPKWEQANDSAGDANFSGSRVGDLCQLDYLLSKQGGKSIAGPKMIELNGGFDPEDGDFSERIVYVNLFAFNESDQVRDALLSIQFEIESCSRGDFLSSTENGVLRSESDTRTITEIADIESMIGVNPDLVVAFDYIRVQSRVLLNTNNDYSDDSEYQERGRVIVISGPKSILLVTSAGQVFKKYEPAPSIEEQNLTVAEQLRAIFGK
jgi:hypothetical protein